MPFSLLPPPPLLMVAGGGGGGLGAGRNCLGKLCSIWITLSNKSADSRGSVRMEANLLAEEQPCSFFPSRFYLKPEIPFKNGRIYKAMYPHTLTLFDQCILHGNFCKKTV